MGAPMQLPKLEDEIERKTYDALMLILDKHAKGEWTTAQRMAGLAVLNTAVLGLISQELAGFIDQAEKEVR